MTPSKRQKLLPECSFGVKEARSEDNIKLKHTQQLAGKLSQLQTMTDKTLWQTLTDAVAEVASGKGHAKATLVNGRDSAHD